MTAELATAECVQVQIQMGRDLQAASAVAVASASASAASRSLLPLPLPWFPRACVSSPMNAQTEKYILASLACISGTVA